MAEKPKLSSKPEYSDPLIGKALAKLKTPEGKEAAKLYFAGKKIQASVASDTATPRGTNSGMPPPATPGTSKNASSVSFASHANLLTSL